MKLARKYFVSIVLVALIVLTYVVTAVAAVSWASCYGTDYNDGVNTLTDSYWADYYYDNSGYYSMNQQNATAKLAYDNMPYDSIFFFSGHGGAGSIVFKDGGTINGYGINVNGAYYINKLSSYKAILTTYASCYSAVYSSWAGSLLDETYYKSGNKCVVGWKDTVDTKQHSTWLKEFNYRLYNKDTISWAIVMADNAVVLRHGIFTGGTEKHDTRGPIEYQKIRW